MQELIHYPLQIYRDKRVLFLTCATESSHWVGAFFRIINGEVWL